MIIVQTTDGLGNQLFQYAIGRRLSILHKTRLFIDSSHFINFRHRKFSLQNFKTNFEEITSYKKLAVKYPVSVLKLKAGCFTKIQEKERSIVDIGEFTSNSFLSGYWQNELYFKNIRQVLLEEIQLKEKNRTLNQFQKNIDNSNSVSIHIRRGDFLELKNKNIFKLLDIDYYKQAVQIIKSKISNPQFYIFSDDIDWTKNNMTFLEHPVYVDRRTGLKDYEELILMSHCKHNIIANSTFSWWAAWLNKSSDKIVIQPKTGFVDPIMQDAYESKNLLYSEVFFRI
jgi:hypothetical protein